MYVLIVMMHNKHTNTQSGSPHNVLHSSSIFLFHVIDPMSGPVAPPLGIVKTDTVTKEVDEIMKQWLTLYACITTISLVMAEIGQLGTPMR